MREEGDYSGLIEENTSPTNILVSKDLTGRPALHYKPVTFFVWKMMKFLFIA